MREIQNKKAEIYKIKCEKNSQIVFYYNRALFFISLNLLNMNKPPKIESKDNASSLKHFGSLQILNAKYLGIPLIKALPTVIFRLFCFWILLSYSSEFYPNCEGNGPGLGLWFPALMIAVVCSINFGIGYKLGLRFEEAITNCITNLVIPVYVDLFFLVTSDQLKL